MKPEDLGNLSPSNHLVPSNTLLTATSISYITVLCLRLVSFQKDLSVYSIETTIVTQFATRNGDNWDNSEEREKEREGNRAGTVRAHFFPPPSL